MRRSTVFWFALAGLCGTVLFHTSQEVTSGRSALTRLDREILREEESIRVLKAEWSYLNQPERLEKLAAQYLQLAPLTAKQFARPGDINERVDDQLIAGTAADMAPLIEPASGLSENPAATKPAPAKDTAKTYAPIAAPAAYAAQPVRVPSSPARTSRQFGDVMKSLEVE